MNNLSINFNKPYEWKTNTNGVLFDTSLKRKGEELNGMDKKKSAKAFFDSQVALGKRYIELEGGEGSFEDCEVGVLVEGKRYVEVDSRTGFPLYYQITESSIDIEDTVDSIDLNQAFEKNGKDLWNKGPSPVKEKTLTSSIDVARKLSNGLDKEDILESIKVCFRQQKYDEAEIIAKKALSSTSLPKLRSEFRYILAMIYFMQSRSYELDEALCEAIRNRKVAEGNPHKSQNNFYFRNEKCIFYLKLSNSCLKQGNYAKAEEATRLGIAIKNRDSVKGKLSLNLVQACLFQKKYDEAREAATRGLKGEYLDKSIRKELKAFLCSGNLSKDELLNIE